MLFLLFWITALGWGNPVVGRYQADWKVVRIEAVKGQVVVRPLWWSGGQAVATRSKDVYEMVNRRECALTFSELKPSGFNSLTIQGHSDLAGTYRRIGSARTGLERILEGDPTGIDLISTPGRPGVDPIQLLERLALSIPSRRPQLFRIIQSRAGSEGSDPRWTRLAGEVAVALGKREEARGYLQRARTLAPGDPKIAAALRRLGDLPSNPAEILPFTLADMYKPPTADEIAQVLQDWKSRDLGPRQVQRELIDELQIGPTRFITTVLSYRVKGQRCHGVIVEPKGRLGPLPVVLDLKGVSVDFFPLSVPGGLLSPMALGGDLGQFILFAPGVRGEALVINGRTFQNDGSPVDAWDGATDDAIAFLTAALGQCPRADPTRIVALGKSRGGTTAMLLGIRDPRVRAVVSWSAPVGWVEHMPQSGWNQLEQVREGLHSQSGPTGPGGQAIRTFLSAALAGGETLAQVRHRLIASSPIYFAERLPSAQLHWGLNDSMVEASNGYALEKVLNGHSSRKSGARFIYEPDGGHDLNPLISGPATRAFLLSQTKKGPGTSPGRKP